MNSSAFIIVSHQIVFQGLFFLKNILLRRRLGVPVRGKNPEANRSISVFALFIGLSVLLGLFDDPVGTVNLVPRSVSLAVALALLVVSLLVGTASLIGLRDSWRVGVLEDQRTDLVETGMYRFSRNPYFLSYLIMFAAYTALLQNVILLVLSIVGFFMIHTMILKEEEHLFALHGETYRQYQKRVPRYTVI